jgi:hypothetical protein
MTFCFEEGVQILRRTPAVLQALLADLREPWVTATEGPSTWSPFDVVDPFDDLRARSVERLLDLGLTHAELARTGRHPEFGVVTLGQHLATWVAHDLSHISQVVRVMAHQYVDAVGPWREYLSILQHQGGPS